MKILHICNNYVSSKVHKELISAIQSKENITQDVYVPIRTSLDDKKNYLESKRVFFEYFNYRVKYLKFLPLIKIIVVFIGIVFGKIKLKHNLVIAHNFWSDGVVAFLNHIFFKSPYILVVRNTDINLFIPRLKHYHWLMRIMIKRAQSLVFVNKAYRDSFLVKYPQLIGELSRIEVIFNGVDSFWLNNIKKSNYDSRSNTLIYVGSFNHNKNIKSIVEASRKIFLKKNDIKLILIGGSYNELTEVLGSSEIPNFIKVMDRVNDKSVLIELYRQAKVFIMPSFHETFGLVYIEALLQGCSVIHSVGQGIDGIFHEDFIQAVNPYSVDDIAHKIEYLLENFEFKNDTADFYDQLFSKFNWKYIADQYLKVMMK